MMFIKRSTKHPNTWVVLEKTVDYTVIHWTCRTYSEARAMINVRNNTVHVGTSDFNELSFGGNCYLRFFGDLVL